MTLKEPHYLTEQGYKNLIKLQVQYEKIVEENKQLQRALNAANTAAAANLNLQQMQEEECKRYKQALKEIEEIAKAKPKKCNHINVGTGDFCHTGCWFHKNCSEHNILDVIKKVKEGENDR